MTSNATDHGPPRLFDVWQKHQDIAMHFNDLILRLRTLSLGGIAALAGLGAGLAHGPTNEAIRWGILAGTFATLSIVWVAIWILDFLYYNRLLLGAVEALIHLEKLSKNQALVAELQLSTIIEKAVTNKPSHSGGSLGRWLFYVLIFLALLSGLVFSLLPLIR